MIDPAQVLLLVGLGLEHQPEPNRSAASRAILDGHFQIVLDDTRLEIRVLDQPLVACPVGRA